MATTTKEEHAEELAKWIVEGEEKDFNEFPSETHPYYRGLAILNGEEYAVERLAAAKERLKEMGCEEEDNG